jgi:tetratricopeptide (TPR) repeat protein
MPEWIAVTKAHTSIQPQLHSLLWPLVRLAACVFIAGVAWGQSGEPQVESPSAQAAPKSAEQIQGETALAQGKLEEALEMFEKALEQEPFNMEVRNYVFSIRGEVARNPETLRRYKKEVKKNPKNAEAWLQLAACYVAANEQEKAIHAYEKVVAMSVEPQSGQANINLILYCATSGRFPEALRAFENDKGMIGAGRGDNFQDKPEDEKYYLAGQCIWVSALMASAFGYGATDPLKQPMMQPYVDAACLMTKESIRINPKNAHAYRSLSGMYSSLGLYQEALPESRRAVELDPNDADSHHGLGSIYFALGQTESAISEYKQAIALQPGLDVAHRGLAQAYLAAGRKEEANEEYETVKKLSPDLAEQMTDFRK